MSLIKKFRLVKSGAYVEDKDFGYRVDTMVYDPNAQELAVAVIRINIATGEQIRSVETISMKKAVEPKMVAAKQVQNDVAEGVNRIQAPDTEGTSEAAPAPAPRRRGSRSAGNVAE